MDVLPRHKLLNALAALTPLAVTLVGHLQPKGMYLHEPVVQGLNLNRRSITGLETEMPVTNIAREINIRNLSYILMLNSLRHEVNLSYIFKFQFVLHCTKSVSF
jgi:hypothetical protein